MAIHLEGVHGTPAEKHCPIKRSRIAALPVVQVPIKDSRYPSTRMTENEFFASRTIFVASVQSDDVVIVVVVVVSYFRFLQNKRKKLD